MEVGGRHAPVALPRERDPVPTVQMAGWAQAPVSTGAENLIPYRPARCKSLYRRRCPGPPSSTAEVKDAWSYVSTPPLS